MTYIASAKRSLENVYKSCIVNCPDSAGQMNMAWTIKVLVILIITTAMAEKLSLPPVKFLEDFVTKYQRTSIVMNLPKEISRNQVLKR